MSPAPVPLTRLPSIGSASFTGLKSKRRPIHHVRLRFRLMEIRQSSNDVRQPGHGDGDCTP
jgi:hypothetical protein